MTDKAWWRISYLASATLVVVLVLLWRSMNAYHIEPLQLTDESQVDALVFERLRQITADSGDTFSETHRIRTGIFVQSLKFFNSNDVNLSGYLWQKYELGTQDQLIPESGEVGFILPEQVDSSMEPEEIYRYEQDGKLLIGWYFESTLRQPFSYETYPFDHKTVWVRMWHKDFSRNVVLVPDFASYPPDLGGNTIFGIEDSIVLGEWVRENTYFDYQFTSYDTNFGMTDYVGQHGFPELRYNFVIKRKFGNAFIVYLLPMLLVAALLYAALLTVGKDKDFSERHGFNTSDFIAATSALFFVVLLGHIELRREFSGSGIVYIEYFYILMYVVLILATANTYLFFRADRSEFGLIHYRDNLIPKAIYWPFVLTAMIAITLFVIARS